MSNLANEIFGAAGQPVTARVGTVVSASPLQISVQGEIFNDVGLIGTAPALGDTVLLLGQAVKGSRSSGSSWVCLGAITGT